MKNLILSLILFNINVIYAQSVLISPNNGSKLIETNSTNKAVQMPSVSATSAITSPQKGMVVFDDATGTLSYFNGSQWVPLSNSTTGWAVNSNNMSSTVAGNIGIGTSNPQAKLHVQSFASSGASTPNFSSAVFENNTHNLISILSPSDTQSGLMMNRPNSVGGIMYNEDESLTFLTDGSNKLSVKANGNVGIGTSSPASKLHTFIGDAGIVSPRTGTIETLETNGSTGYLSILTPNTASAGVTFGSPDGNADGSINYNHLTQKLTLNTKASTKMTIDSIGNVGIADTAPEVRLDVNGAVHIQKDILLKERLLQPSTSASYDPFDRQDKSFVTIEPSTNVISTIKGFSVPTTAATFGTVLYLSNGQTGSIVLKNNAATVQNDRIITNTGADVTITGRGGAIFIYDFTGWRLIAYAE